VIGYNLTRGIFRNSKNPLILLLLLCLLTTCIDPFNPDLKGTTSLLVVDALLTNENRSYTVELSRTTQIQNTAPTMVSWAQVVIKTGDGAIIPLQEIFAGVYITDSLQFVGETGKSYTLYIKTYDGEEYESEPCVMYPVQPVDSVYFNKDQEFINNGSEVLDGIRIFVDSKNEGDGKYVRWTYDEWWKFIVPFPKKYEYISETDIPTVDQVKEVCWGHNSSNDIAIKSTVAAQNNRIEKEPILFVASGLSERLLVQYCIEIKQLSLSKTEFEFWDQMKQLNDEGGDIFQKQPFSITGNIHNINNPDEPVLGYFQVSAVEHKRVYITPDEIEGLNLPEYKYACDRIEIGPGDYQGGNMTFDKIYADFTLAEYIFIEPIYDLRWNLQKLVFVKPFCADCTTRGSLAKPDFWFDLVPYHTKK
jgi:hypothetical protein